MEHESNNKDFKQSHEKQIKVPKKLKYGEHESSSKDFKQSHEKQIKVPRKRNYGPQEMSSKRPVTKFRDIFKIKKSYCRDPRFDDLSGTLDKESFDEDYSFLQDMREREKDALKKGLKETEDGDEREKISSILKRMKNQDAAKKQVLEMRAKREQRREESIRMLNEGQKPYFPRETEEEKIEKLKVKFERLKKDGKLDKYMERKRKRMFKQDVKVFRD